MKFDVSNATKRVLRKMQKEQTKDDFSNRLGERVVSSKKKYNRRKEKKVELHY